MIEAPVEMVERHLDVRTEAEQALKEDSVPAGHSVVFSIRIPVVLRLKGHTVWG